MRILAPVTLLLLVALALLAPAASAPAAERTYAYDVPVDRGSPWPYMRRDRRNTGQSPVRGVYGGDRPWSFATGKGIFSTPVLGADGTAYVGSADTTFYALGTSGKPRWRFRTGGIIDAAALVGPNRTVTIGSGDEYLYRLRTGRRPRKRVVWRYRAEREAGGGQLVHWWEGNVGVSFDGTLLTGNTDGHMYAVSPGGKLRWEYTAGNSVWTAPALADDGTSYWGSVDLFVYALNPDGSLKWRVPTVGFVVSSPALSKDGSTLYIGSFDAKLYALDAATGAVKWTFTTGEHIYSSPALDEGEDGAVRAIYVASTDGSVYALDPAGGLKWRYDTGDAVRSSPVIGRAPSGDGRIVYVGSSNGVLYALDAETGRRRWSFDTTARDRVLRDRNDLNASPALGERGVYIAGEDGHVTYVPYDWCLKRRDRRCQTGPGEAFARDVTAVYPVTAGGNTRIGSDRQRVAAATVMPLRLVVRKGGETRDASMVPLPDAESLVTTDPPFDFTAELSGDGHHLFVVPRGFLAPGRDYRVRLSGNYTASGIPITNVRIGGTEAGTFDQDLVYRVARSSGRIALRPRRESTSAFNLRRLAVPLPTFLPSVNQIGFDSYDWIVGTVEHRSGGRLLMWVIGSKRGRRGTRVADPKSEFAFPLAGTLKGDSLILSQRDLTLTFSFGPVPLDLIEFRAQMDQNLRARPGANLYAEVTCADVPTYGPFLPTTTRLCNQEGKLAASGTFITDGYRAGPANRRPAGVRVARIERSGDSVVADLALRRGVRYPARRHVASILLADDATGQPVNLDYKAQTRVTTDRRGNVRRVTLDLPDGTELPERVRAYVMADVFPLGARSL